MTAGRTPAEAAHAFRDALQRLLSCVASAPLTVHGGYYTAEQPHQLTTATGLPVRLGGAARLALVLRLRYRFVPNEDQHRLWRVSTVAYQMALEDQEGRAVVAYHWHPFAGTRVQFPHLHVEPGSNTPAAILGRAHLPTGHVGLADVLRLAITELGVRPVRTDWTEILNRAADD